MIISGVATAAGKVFKFKTVAARYVRTTFTKNSHKNESGGRERVGEAGSDPENDSKPRPHQRGGKRQKSPRNPLAGNEDADVITAPNRAMALETE